MTTNALKTNNDLFTEAEVDFVSTLGKLIYLDKKEVPDYQNIVINGETGEILMSAIVDESTGRVIPETVPEGVTAEVRSRPIEGTLTAFDLILEAEDFGNQIEITVPSTAKVEGLTYNQEAKLLGLTARHWSRTTRNVVNGRTNYGHTQGFKLRAEDIESSKVTGKAANIKYDK